MLIELHMIQNFAPSNLNRDDTNNPKDCEFGGVRRARISSQCLKRAIRLSPVFAKTTQTEVGIRTKFILSKLKEKLISQGKPEDDSQKVLDVFIPAYISKLEKKNDKTVVLFYISTQETDEIVGILLENWKGLLDAKVEPALVEKICKDLRKKYKGITSAPDIALFGRMLAEQPELGLEAACQVAHAISTHRVNMEMDFYTAVDDLQKTMQDSEPGAGMMGFTAFNSACFYRYACIDWDQLTTTLQGDISMARKTVEAFIRASIAAFPSGKQTSFAANNPPNFLLCVIKKEGSAWSLANAFEDPVKLGRNGGFIVPSIESLDKYWGRLESVYGNDDLVCVAALGLEDELPVISLKPALLPNQSEWLKKVLSALPKD